MRPATAPNARERGFGLIELLVTVVVLGTVLGVVFGAMFRSQDHTQHLTKVADQRQMARTAVQLIEREARMAGSGWGRLTVNYSNNGVAATISAINPVFGGTPNSDALVMLGAWQANSTLSTALTTQDGVIRVADSDGFAPNDLILVTNLSTAHLFQVTGVVSASDQLDHATSSSFNVSSGFTSTWPPGGYPVGSAVYKVTVSTYQYDSSSYAKPALVRFENGGAAQVVAYNVDGFRVHYELDDGSRTRNPADLSRISRIIPVVATRVRDARRPTLQDSVWAMIRPRTF